MFNWLFKKTGKKIFSFERFSALLLQYHHAKILDRGQVCMMESIYQFNSIRVRDILTPRSQMMVIDINADSKSYLSNMARSLHSRFPVVEDSLDNVKGIILAKDLLKYYLTNHDSASPIALKSLLRPATFIPETMRLERLLTHFQSSRNHMAIVIDEYGGVSGLVTIEDVIEQVMGDINDEHDIHAMPEYIQEIAHNVFSVDALTPVEAFNGFFNVSQPANYFATIGGLVAQQFGHIPSKGEKIELEGLTITVIKANIRTIELIEVTLKSPLQDKSSS